MAALDFQYVGGGCGMEDVAYFADSCLFEDECESWEADILAFYLLDKETAHTYLKKELSLPEYYGANLDALWDCLTTDFSQKRIIIFNPEIIVENLGAYGESLIRLFEDAAIENDNIEVQIKNSN